VPEDLLPLQELARIDQPVEDLLGHEPVVDALAFARSRGAGGGRDGEMGLGLAFAHQADDRSLADPGRSGDDEQPPDPA
jgi:hypothetical protein